MFKYEPAHGYFLRLAERNSAHSVRVFADSLGLNGRDFDIEELLHFCQRFPIQNIEELIAATPSIQKSFVSINGQKVRKSLDWSLRQPRVCAACLGEARYYRNWWDLTFVRRCPIHDRPLIEGGSHASTLAWWYPTIGVTPEGHDLAIAGALRAEHPRESWDAYVLGRMGILSPFSVPFLDNSEMYEVVSAVECVGKAVLFGHGRRASKRLKRDDRYRALLIGFGAFREGADGLEVAIRECNSRAGSTKNAEVKSPAAFFGWLYSGARGLPPSRAKREILVAMSRVAHSHNVNTRGGVRAVERVTTLKSVASQLGIKPKHLHDIAEKCGLLSGERNSGKYHFLSDEAVEVLREIKSDLIRMQEALRLTGLTPKRFLTFCKSNSIVAFLHNGTSGAKYRRSQILAAKSRTSDLNVEIETGTSAHRYCFQPRPHPKDVGLSVGDVAAQLGILPDRVRRLVDAGCLQTVTRDRAKNSRLRIDNASFEAFHRKYLVATAYAAVLECAPSNAYKHLRASGIDRLVVPSLTDASFVEREKVREALGLTADPDDEHVFPVLSFWSQLRDFFRRCGSPVLVYVRQDHHSAALISGNRSPGVLLTLEPEKKQMQFGVRFDLKSAPKSAAKFVMNLERIRKAWPTATCEEECDVWAFRDCHQSFVISNRLGWDEYFDWIDKRTLLLRAFFGFGLELATKGAAGNVQNGRASLNVGSGVPSMSLG
ncbi:MAG: TniQ family protein [Rhizomicrobium sp.]